MVEPAESPSAFSLQTQNMAKTMKDLEEHDRSGEGVVRNQSGNSSGRRRVKTKVPARQREPPEVTVEASGQSVTDVSLEMLPSREQNGSLPRVRTSSMAGSVEDVGSDRVSSDRRWLSTSSKRCHMEMHDKPLILCVDDDAINHMVLETFFKPHGFAIEVAMSGFEAMSFLEENNVLPDVVLLDVMMPGMSGLEVATKIRELFPKENIPVIMLSALSSDDDIVSGLKSGSHDYITKPFSKPELLARVQLQLDIKTKASQSLNDVLLRMPYIEKRLPPTVLARLKRGSLTAFENNPKTKVLVVKMLGITELMSVDTQLAFNMLHRFITLCDRFVDTHGLQRVEHTGACFGSYGRLCQETGADRWIFPHLLYPFPRARGEGADELELRDGWGAAQRARRNRCTW